MNRKYMDLIAVLVLAAVTLVIALLGVDLPLIRVPLGLLLVLVLPGYALVAALFPRHPLRLAERIVVIVGVSLVCTILGGLALDITPWGLTTNTWAVLLSLITVAGVVVAGLRRTGGEPVPAIAGGRLLPSLSIPQALLFGLAALVVAGALGMARAGALEAPTPGYTQLWLLPDGTGTPQQVRVGVSNAESTPVQYKLQLIVNGNVAQEWANVPLAPGAKWETTTTLPADLPKTQPVAALLYRRDSPNTVYRRVAWWPGSEPNVAAGQPTATLPTEWPIAAAPPGAPTATPGLLTQATAVAVVPTPAPAATQPVATATAPALAPAATATPGVVESTNTATPEVTSSTLHIGTVAVATGLNGVLLRVRQNPGLQATQIGAFGVGTIVLIQDGPRSADGMDWWQIIGWSKTGQAGWVSGTYLQAVSCCQATGGGH
jgi:uncharacterized membrane protein